MQSGEQASHGGERIRDRAAVNSGVQIHFGAGDLQFQRCHTAQPVAHRRNTARNHSGIGNDNDLRFQRLPILGKKIAEIGAANLFFAFDDEMQIHREIAGGLDLLLHSENV